MGFLDELVLYVLIVMLAILAFDMAEAKGDYIDSYEQIMSNNPNMDRLYAKQIAAIVQKYGKQYKVSTEAFIAIMMVESTYKLDAFNKSTQDYGIAQISKRNVEELKLSKKKLMSDLDYSIKWGMHVYTWFYIRYPLNQAIRRYNCGTRPKCIYTKKSRKYLKLVLKYM